jgi:hypothetical protein
VRGVQVRRAIRDRQASSRGALGKIETLILGQRERLLEHLVSTGPVIDRILARAASFRQASETRRCLRPLLSCPQRIDGDELGQLGSAPASSRGSRRRRSRTTWVG